MPLTVPVVVSDVVVGVPACGTRPAKSSMPRKMPYRNAPTGFSTDDGAVGPVRPLAASWVMVEVVVRKLISAFWIAARIGLVLVACAVVVVVVVVVVVESVAATGAAAASATALVALVAVAAAAVAAAGGAAVAVDELVAVVAVAAVGRGLVLDCWPVAVGWSAAVLVPAVFLVPLPALVFLPPVVDAAPEPEPFEPDEAVDPVLESDVADEGDPDESVVTAVAGRGFFAGLRALPELLEVVPEALLDESLGAAFDELFEEELPSPPLALAMPVPLAIAAPRPRVTALTPSQL